MSFLSVKISLFHCQNFLFQIVRLTASNNEISITKTLTDQQQQRSSHSQQQFLKSNYSELSRTIRGMTEPVIPEERLESPLEIHHQSSQHQQLHQEQQKQGSEKPEEKGERQSPYNVSQSMKMSPASMQMSPIGTDHSANEMDESSEYDPSFLSSNDP